VSFLNGAVWKTFKNLEVPQEMFWGARKSSP